ncbi:MAG: Rrf2 family transcriptional regulator [Planctomycetota bacterium]
MNSDLAIALHIVGFLTASDGRSLTSETLASTYGTSPVVVRRILSKLSKAGLVETRRGSGGGSLLARSSDQIDLRQVYEAVSENTQLFRRHPGDESGVARVLADYIDELYAEAEEALMAKLESVSVKQMDAIVKPRICGRKS